MEFMENPAASLEKPSKTQRKREMHGLQDLGERLTQLTPERLAALPLSDALREAVLDARRMNRHEARRRQMQYIGRLMRDIDPEPIRAAFAEIDGSSAAAIARSHRLERLRARLLEDETVLTEIGREHPGADLTRLRQLRRNALDEQARGRPPRALRELFRLLREIDAAALQPQRHRGPEEGS